MPYRVCLVELDEGPRVVSNLPYEGRKPLIGSRVSVTFRRLTDEVVLPQFEFRSENDGGVG